MRRAAVIAFALLSLAALSDCGRKPQIQQQAQPQQTGSSQPTAPAPAPQQSSGGLFSSSCPQPPLKSQVENALKSAMTQIYGADETGAHYAVVSMTPTADCKTLTVAYKASSAPASAPMTYGDDGKWSLTLYKKTYPVQ